MPKRIQKYITTLVSLLATVILTLLSDFILNLPVEITWLTFFTGTIITISVTLLEQRLLDVTSEELSKKLEIFQLLEQIDDVEIQQLAKETIEDCTEQLRKFKQGIIPSTFQAHLTNRLNKCQKKFQATFWVNEIDFLYRLEDSFAGRNYFEMNKKAIERGIKIERIFLIKRTSVVDDNGNIFNEKALRIVNNQKNAGISVRVGWTEDLEGRHYESDIYQDFGIIDGIEVLLQLHGVGDSMHGSMLIKQNDQVRKYAEVFRKLQNLSRPLDEVLEKYPPVANSNKG